MASAYPGAIDSFSARVDNTHDVMAADVNSLQEAIVAIETKLGINVMGTVTDLVTRLARSLSATGNLDFATATTLTISSGSVTPTQNWHLVDTESAAASDDLTTIATTNVTDGFILYLRQVADARDVTIKHATGNIKCPSGVDIVLTDSTQVVTLIYDATLAVWLASPSPASVGTLNGTNIWSAMNSFTKAVNFAYTSASATITLDTTHKVVDVNAAAGAVSVFLPTAVGCNGREYTICKTDSSGNQVTIDGSGSETINGALTKVLTTQYETVTLISTGAGWRII